MRRLLKRAALALAAPRVVSAPAVRGAEPGVDLQRPQALAEQGDASSQVSLGRMYRDGDGVPQDHAKAAHWYRKAAEQGHTGGQVALGRMYYDGEGVPQDDAKAAHWCRKAAEQGNSTCQWSLGSMYHYGDGVPQDDVRAYAWYNLAAAGGDEGARKGRDELLERMSPEQVAEAQALSRDLAAQLRE